ncbi:hypothetical protein B27N_02660 [Alcanivorax marinus]|nr:hypothetical protein [Alloalcanivorax marinus]
MNVTCPRCRSDRLLEHHPVRQICSALGAAAGVAGGLAAAGSRARIGITVGSVAGPASAAVAGLAGAIIGVLGSSFAWGTAGAAAGDLIDETVLNTLECLECGYRFSVEPQ